MLRILLEGNASRERLGAEAQRVIRRRKDKIERNLPLIYRGAGRTDLARRKSVALLLKSPTELDLYVDLVKSYLFPLARTLRKLRKL